MKKSINAQHLFKIILTAILIALNVILERFLAYSVWNQTISFGFVAIAFAAAFLGTPYAVVVAGLGDVIGAIFFPFGTYFPGFTVTNCVYGLILAEFLYKNATPIRIIIGVILNKIVCTLTLNTLWISIMYRGGVDAFLLVLPTRLAGAVLMTAAELIIILLFFTNKSRIRILLEKNLNRII